MVLEVVFLLFCGLAVMAMLVGLCSLVGRVEGCALPDEPWTDWEGDIPPEFIDGAPNRPAGRVLGHDLGPGEMQRILPLEPLDSDATWGPGWPE